MNSDHSTPIHVKPIHVKPIHLKPVHLKTTALAAAVIVSTLLTGCASSRIPPEGSAEVRSKLTNLQSDPQLASRAPVAIQDAEVAVVMAEKPQRHVPTGAHLVYLADHKVDIATARAQTLLLEDQRKTLSEQREQARLDARTREADSARRDATFARNDAADARTDAAYARTDADTARMDADLAQLESDKAKQEMMAANAQSTELQSQIDELNAKATERGLVVTLGDLLFATGKSELKTNASGHLDKLAAFLNKYEDRSVVIEGHTDSVGSEASNLSLSQRRAEAVKSHLLNRGVAAARIETAGKGEATPLTENETTSGRQQNRRVEVIITNEPVAMTKSGK